MNKTQFASIVENIKLRWLLQRLGLKSKNFDSGDVEAILRERVNFVPKAILI